MMRGIWTIFKKEWIITFSSPVAYVIIGSFLGILNYFFISTTVLTGYWSSSEVFESMIIVVLMFCPLISMRFIAEEKKNKTLELLLTSPIRSFDIIFGKYIFILSIFVLILGLSLWIPLIISSYISIEWGVLLWQYIGLFLLIASVLSIGFVFSSLTENQITAGILGMCFSLLLYIVSMVIPSISNEFFYRILSELTILQHYQSFLNGYMDIKDVLYFVILNFFCLLLSERLLYLGR